MKQRRADNVRINMKIALLNFTGGMPLGLAYLSAYVRDLADNHQVCIIDCSDMGDNRDVIDTIEKMGLTIIGATVYTYHVTGILSFFEKVKQLMPHVITVVGGPHPTALPSTMLENDSIDIAVMGEGEITFSEMIQKMDDGRDYFGIDGVAYMLEGRVVINTPRKLIKNLDQFPHAAWDLLRISQYKHQKQGHPRMNKGAFTNMLASRGCPYSCIFCGAADIWGRKLRLHSPSRMIEEIKELHNNYGVYSIRFSDSTFTLNRAWVLEFCNLLKLEKIDVAWSANARANTIDKEMILTMKSAGCKIIKMGVESGDERILKIAKKGQGLEEVRRAFALLRECGVFSWAFFMIGLPGETKETIEKTITFAEEIDPDQVSVVGYAIPYPGTELYEIASKDHAMDFPWSSYHHSRKILYVPKGLTKEDIEEGKRRFCERLQPGERQRGRSFSG